MIRLRSISEIRTKDVGVSLMTRLLAIFPEGNYADIGFRAILADDDPRLPLVLHELHKAGLRAEPTGKYKAAIPGKEYSDKAVARYEDQDFNSAQAVSWNPNGLFPRFDEENYTTKYPSIRLLSLEDSLDKEPFASTNFDHLLATLAGRKILEEAAFVGVSFAPAFL